MSFIESGIAVIVQCMGCSKMKTKTGRWFKPWKTKKFISHGYCKPCYKAEMERIKREFDTRKFNQ